MIFFLLLIIAFISYAFGNLSVVRIGSKLIFKRNLKKLGRGSSAYAAFYREYGWQGVLKLAIVEIVLDATPVILGGILLRSHELEPVGRTFALFCVVMGKQWPFLHYFRGENAVFALIIGSFCISFSIGIVSLVVTAALLYVFRFVKLTAPVASVALTVLNYLVLDDAMVAKLCWCITAVVLVYMIPTLFRILNGKEAQISFEKDLSYKFDQRF